MTKDIKALQDIAEFDHPFIVNMDGSVSHLPRTYEYMGIHAPEVWHDEENDIEIDGKHWEALTGFTNQYGYNGAVLHSSEFIGGGLADDILNNPGIYVVVAVEVMPSAEEGEDPFPAGWAVMRYTPDDAPCCRAVVTSGDPNMHEPGCNG